MNVDVCYAVTHDAHFMHVYVVQSQFVAQLIIFHLSRFPSIHSTLTLTLNMATQYTCTTSVFTNKLGECRLCVCAAGVWVYSVQWYFSCSVVRIYKKLYNRYNIEIKRKKDCILTMFVVASKSSHNLTQIQSCAWNSNTIFVDKNVITWRHVSGCCLTFNRAQNIVYRVCGVWCLVFGFVFVFTGYRFHTIIMNNIYQNGNVCACAK